MINLPPQTIPNHPQPEIKKIFSCCKCDKILSRIDSLHRHEQKCNKIQDNSKLIQIKDIQIIEQKLSDVSTDAEDESEDEELKNSSLYKLLKVERDLIVADAKREEAENKLEEMKKLLAQYNTTNTMQTNNNIETQNNIGIQNNNTINFNGPVYITAPNNEIFTLTKDQTEEILNEGTDGPILCIKLSNFDKNNKCNHNFCTPNQNSTVLKYYDEKSSSIMNTEKKHFYIKAIENSIDRIINSYNKFKDKFNKNKREKFEEVIKNLTNIKYQSYTCNQSKYLRKSLDILAYNYSKIVLKTWNEIVSKIDNSQIREDYLHLFIILNESYIETFSNENEIEQPADIIYNSNVDTETSESSDTPVILKFNPKPKKTKKEIIV